MSIDQRFNFIVTDASPVLNTIDVPEKFATLSVPVNMVEEEQTQEEPSTVTENIQNYVDDEGEYLCNANPGLVVIFNQKTFDNHTKRRGTISDINALVQTFSRFGFIITENDIHTDFTRDQILQTLKTISAQDHSQRNCLIVIIMTHGDKNNALQARDAPLYADEIWNPFTIEHCPTLKDKVKFFIFQACKGTKTSIPSIDIDSSTDIYSSSELVSSAFFSTPLERDMLVAFASVEGNESYRHIYEGAWFIQELCQNFSIYGHLDDVMSLLIRTAGCVAHNYYHVTEPIQAPEPSELNSAAASEIIRINKQMPIFLSTLRKRFYLNRSIERNRLLHMIEQQRKMEELANKISTKIENGSTRSALKRRLN